jgi:hypothetical protein
MDPAGGMDVADGAVVGAAEGGVVPSCPRAASRAGEGDEDVASGSVDVLPAAGAVADSPAQPAASKRATMAALEAREVDRAHVVASDITEEEER